MVLLGDPVKGRRVYQHVAGSPSLPEQPRVLLGEEHTLGFFSGF